MRAPALFGIIVLIHATAIGAFSLMQGCATRRPGEGLPSSRRSFPATSPRSRPSARRRRQSSLRP